MCSPRDVISQRRHCLFELCRSEERPDSAGPPHQRRQEVEPVEAVGGPQRQRKNTVLKIHHVGRAKPGDPYILLSWTVVVAQW